MSRFTHSQLTDPVDLAARQLMRDDPARFTVGTGGHKPNVPALVEALMLRGAIRGSIDRWYRDKLPIASYIEDNYNNAERQQLLENYLPTL